MTSNAFISADLITVLRSSVGSFSCCGDSKLGHHLRDAERHSSIASKELAHAAALATDPNSKIMYQRAEQASIDGYYTAHDLKTEVSAAPHQA